jgi:hypothetical protein
MFKTFFTLWTTLLAAAEWLLVATLKASTRTFLAASRTKKAAKGEVSLSKKHYLKRYDRRFACG